MMTQQYAGRKDKAARASSGNAVKVGTGADQICTCSRAGVSCWPWCCTELSRPGALLGSAACCAAAGWWYSTAAECAVCRVHSCLSPSSCPKWMELASWEGYGSSSTWVFPRSNCIKYSKHIAQVQVRPRTLRPFLPVHPSCSARDCYSCGSCLW